MDVNSIVSLIFRLIKASLVFAFLTLTLAACRLPVSPELLPIEPTATLPAPPVLSQTATPPINRAPQSSSTPTPRVVGNFETIMQFNEAPQGKLQDEWLGADGILWVSSDKGLYQYQSQHWLSVFEGDAGRILGADQAGRIWVVLDNGTRIAAVKALKTKIYDANQGWSALLQTAPYLRGFGDGLVTDNKGRVWVATGQDDLRRFDPQTDRWEKFNSGQIGLNPAVDLKMETNLITDVLLTRDGSVWVSSCSTSAQAVAGQSIEAYDGQHWHPIVETADQCVFDMETDSAGNIWVGGFDQILFYNNAANAWKNIPLPAFERRQLIFSIDIDPAQRPWVEVGLGGGASLWGSTVRYHLEGTQWVQDLNPGGFVLSDIAFNPEGDSWLCADGAVQHYKEGKTQQVAQLDTFDCTVVAGKQGQVFVAARDGSDNGIWQLVK